MTKRLFIAINLTDEIARQVETAFSRAIPPLQKALSEEIRPTTLSQWHFTLTFLGNQDIAWIDEIVQTLKRISPHIKPPLLTIERITYNRPNAPRMIWANGSPETSKALHAIKVNLEDELEENGMQWHRETRRFHAHITLARLKGVRRDKLPHLDIPCNASFIPRSIDLMESELRRSGPRYVKLFGARLENLK